MINLLRNYDIMKTIDNTVSSQIVEGLQIVKENENALKFFY